MPEVLSVTVLAVKSQCPKLDSFSSQGSILNLFTRVLLTGRAVPNVSVYRLLSYGTLDLGVHPAQVDFHAEAIRWTPNQTGMNFQK